MIQSLTKALRIPLVLALFSPLYFACTAGPSGECASTKDCASKGTGYVCKADANKVNKCVKDTAPTCTPACKTGETCENGACKPAATGCKADTDCKSGEKCNNGKCEPAATGCKADTDCKAGEKCDSGTCKPGTPTCTPPCAAGETCENGTCKKPTGCKTDTDCKAGEKCDSGACKPGTPPPTCTKDGDCKSGEKCNSGKCEPGTPPPTCTKDGDCKSGEKCTNGKCVAGGCTPACGAGQVCQNGQCVAAPPGKDVGQTCTQTDTCNTGLQCIGITQTEAVCFQPCNADADCKDAFRNKCITAGTASDGTPIKLCLHDSAKGEKCGFRTKEQGLCKEGQDPVLYCSPTKNTCESAVKQTTEGSPCNKESDNTEPPKYCDSKAGLTCDQATGTCKKAKLAKEGQDCDPDGTNTGVATLCDQADKLICVSFSQDGSLKRCHKECDTSKADDCKHTAGLSCLGLSGGGTRGVCLDTQCATDAECAFPESQCVSLQSGGKACFPKPPSGPTPYGGICKNPTSQFGCDTKKDAKLLCLRGTSTDPAGFCSRDCTADGTCPEWTDGTKKIAATCTPITQDGSFKACIFVCGQPGQECPTGLVCKSVGSGSACLAGP